MIEKILSGEKTIESRWYKSRRVPWDKIDPGDKIFFKETGSPVTCHAKVIKVLQITLKKDEKHKSEIIQKHSKSIGLKPIELEKIAAGKRYLILLFLQDPELLKQPFEINKTGYGIQTSWITLKSINTIKKAR